MSEEIDVNDQHDMGPVTFVLSVAAIIALFVVVSAAFLALLGGPVLRYVPLLIAWPLIAFFMLRHIERDGGSGQRTE